MRSFLPVLLLTASPAVAQDLADQLAQAARAFTCLGTESFDTRDRSDDDPFVAVVPELEGDWTMDAFDPATGGLDPARLAKGCQDPTTLVQTAPRTLEFRPPRWRSDWLDLSATVRLDYVVSHTFDRSITEEDWIDASDAWDEENYIPYFFAAPLFRGEVYLFHPSLDVLVFFDPEGAPDLLARCP